MGYVPDHVRRIKSSNADRYVFRDESSSNMVGVEAFLQMLAEFGASSQHASRKYFLRPLKCLLYQKIFVTVLKPSQDREQ